MILLVIPQNRKSTVLGPTTPKTNMDTQNDTIFERRYNLKTIIFGIYVRFGGCTFSHLTLDMVTAKRQVISQTISIFCAVLLFQGCNGVLAPSVFPNWLVPNSGSPDFLSQRTTFGISLDDIREGFWGRDILGPLCLFLGLGGNNLTEIYTSSYNHGSVLKMGPSNRIVSFQTGREKMRKIPLNHDDGEKE